MVKPGVERNFLATLLRTAERGERKSFSCVNKICPQVCVTA